MDKESKVEHVKSAKQTRSHECHWPGCSAQVPPAKWGCVKHWFTLPVILRNEIWKNYKIGQEDKLNPSKEYLETARKTQEWIEKYIALRESGHTNKSAQLILLEEFFK